MPEPEASSELTASPACAVSRHYSDLPCVRPAGHSDKHATEDGREWYIMSRPDFEIHLTVSADHASKLAAFAADRGVKFVHILLDRGEEASQPMLTLHGWGSLTDQHQLAGLWQTRLQAEGMTVTRMKVEAAPWWQWIPHSDGAASREPEHRYFEHHVKLVLPMNGMTRAQAAIGAAVEPHDARLSRNARRVRPDGMHERFVTQRCHGVGQVTARARLDGLLAALNSLGFPPVSVEQEYVVFDSRLDVDRGWFDAPATAKSEVAS